MKIKNQSTIIRTENEFYAAVEEAASQQLLVIDTEYTKEDQYGKAHIIGVAWGYPSGSVFKSFYAPFRHEYFPTYWNLDVALLQEFKRFSTEAVQVYHNWSADHTVLVKEGIDFSDRTIFDTMIAQHLCDENYVSYSLDYLANKKFKVRKQSLTDLEKELDKKYGKGKGWAHIHPDMMGMYACKDIFLTYLLCQDAQVELRRQRLENLYARYEEFIKVLHKVVSRGLHVNEDLALQLQDEARTEMRHLANKYEFKLSSSQKVAHHLHDTLGVPVKFRTDKGAPSTSSVSLRRYTDLARESSSFEPATGFIKDVLRYRTLHKAVSTWYEGFLRQRGTDGLLHPGLTIAGAENDSGGGSDDVKGGTKTGRLSCRKPNLQQVPRSGKARELLVSPPGHVLVKCDLSQAELRLISYYMEKLYKDSRMADAFRNDDDLHTQTAEAMGLFKYMDYKDGRQVGKTCNFSLGYRAGIDQLKYILYRDANIDAKKSDVAKWHTAWHNTYPGVRWLNEFSESYAKDHGYVKMWNGRKRHLQGKDCFKAFNSIVQGGVGQIVVECMIEIDHQRPDLQMVLQIHDELDFYLMLETEEEDIEWITGVMSSIPTQRFKLPFTADAKRWSN